jgi:hypothetical protein
VVASLSSEGIPTGLPFSHLYLERPQPRGDSPTARARLGFYILEIDVNYRVAIATRLQLELGTVIASHKIDQHFAKCTLAQLLDSVTYTFRELPRNASYTNKMPALEWAKFVQRVFNEEAMTYVLDDRGGVHPAPDQEFVTNKAATIACLSSARYEAVRILFEKGVSELRLPSGNNSAIRHTFEACENLFKLMFDCNRLGEAEIEKSLRPTLKKHLDPADLIACGQMIGSMKSWTTAAHQFRHAAGTEAPLQATTDFAVLMVSTGAAYIRWLVSLDQSFLRSKSNEPV